MKADRFLAHSSDDGRVQLLTEHLDAVSILCGQFARSFESEAQGRLIGLAHDIGKCSYEFQKRLQGGPIVDHSSAGALECARMNALWAACCVAGHHGGLPDVGNIHNDRTCDPTLYGRLKKAHSGGIPTYELPVSLPTVPPPSGFDKDHLSNSFIIRMLYSCLVDADYLDTEKFMSNGTVERNRGDSLPLLLEKLNQYISLWWNPSTALNQYRCDILKSCIASGSNDRGFYTLTVPTGGGKTIASMAFALHHAVTHGMDRVIYVIPYTSIIEQTAAVFRNIFGAHNVVEHHVNASFEVGESDSMEQYAQIRATENWDAPIIVTTAVQFFESAYANRPAKCRKLHNVANSVIIFDEAQMLPTEHLRPCVAVIAKLVARFRATAVLCTATQPVLNDLFEEYAPGLPITELCPNATALFSQFRRVTFRNAGSMNPESLSAELAALPQVLCIVNSRKAAQEIFHRLPPEGSYHLSTLMYPAHRRATLSEIRKRLMDGLPCRVVSTSLIEAGVDVDFPAVYREMAGLDSILQAAGRCNREGIRFAGDSIVTIFEGVSVTPQMLKVNIGATKETLAGDADPSNPETVSHYFTTYRSLLANSSLDKYGVICALQRGIQGQELPFRTVAGRFHLIDGASKTVYIPLGDGEALVRRVQAGERSRKLFRELGQYCVSVYEKHFQTLHNSGSLMPLDADSAILKDLEKYQEQTGLALEDNATFLCI